MVIIHDLGVLRIPVQSATQIRLKAPLDSDSFRHSIPFHSATPLAVDHRRWINPGKAATPLEKNPGSNNCAWPLKTRPS
jgi:hypothetical protein